MFTIRCLNEFSAFFGYHGALRVPSDYNLCGVMAFSYNRPNHNANIHLSFIN